MTLTDIEKALVLSLWEKIAPKAETLGAEAMDSLTTSSKEAAKYFEKFDISKNSPDMLAHGGKIMHAIGDAIKNYDKLKESMTTLTDLHVNTIHVTRDLYELMCGCIIAVLSKHFPEEFNDKMAAVWKPFLDEVCRVLAGSEEK
ncbi:hemoglobin subunit alpha-3-like isoform X1 [Pelobates fuscus]|uniref:hemoglobin subunit alpha-3-like isoform X1 n=1 Tax=Pelobates fuscus TaxID=191477 RepID=UPI002FE42FA9